MTGLPLLLDLAGRRVLVVGGGQVATRRVERLLEVGARVEVVAPEISAALARFAQPPGPAGAGTITLWRRPFAESDVPGAWLVFACAGDPVVNALVAAAAEANGTFCIRADSAPGGTARMSAVLSRGDVVVAVNGGDDPRRAAGLRDAISLALDLGTLGAPRFREAGTGSVALVGGGPGDPELITVRGRRLVAEADVVVVDRLAPRELLAGLADGVEIIDCGKAAHRHNLTQQEINDVLVDRARAGKRVVRLKGGDPFIFGRGGEEVLACVAAGVQVRVVPGISSALAAPAAAGIPLTHRGVAADFTVVSGHLDPGRPPGGGLDWSALAAGPSTLVLLMAMERLADIAAELIRLGRSPHSPAAAIHRATLPGQRVVRAPLAELAAAVHQAGLAAPAVVVIGDVVRALPPF